MRCASGRQQHTPGRASWSMACSSLGPQAVPNPLTPTLELPPRAQTAQTAPQDPKDIWSRPAADSQIVDCISLVLTLPRSHILEESIGAKKAS